MKNEKMNGEREPKVLVKIASERRHNSMKMANRKQFNLAKKNAKMQLTLGVLWGWC